MTESINLHFSSAGGSTRLAPPPVELAAVIPAYNEGLVIGSVVLQAKQHVDRVIVVDDGSTDRTWSGSRGRISRRRSWVYTSRY